MHCGPAASTIEHALFDEPSPNNLSPAKLSSVNVCSAKLSKPNPSKAKLARGISNLSHDIIDSLGELDELTHKSLINKSIANARSS